MQILRYIYPTIKLHAGSSLGNLATFVQLDPEGNIHGLWSAADNSFYLGRLSIEFSSDGRKVVPVETVFEPLCQTTLFRESGLEISKKIRITFSDNLESPQDELRRVFLEIDARNTSASASELRIVVNLTFPAMPSPLFTKKPPAEETNKQFSTSHDSRSVTVRELSTSGKLVVRFSEPASIMVSDGKTAHVEFEISIPAGETVSLKTTLMIEPSSGPNISPAAQVNRNWTRSNDSSAALDKLLQASDILTPSGIINRGIYWAKANTVQVQHRFRSGFGFTNDPPQDIVVVRDLAWYIMGCDYLNPAFSRKLIDLTEKYCYHTDGKLTEFIHANEIKPDLHDYDLNINDDTPLFILALLHHAKLSGEQEFTGRAFRLASRAANYILSQVKNGLVYCDANGTNVMGIASWRNIIDDYNLTGYVTEINAECVEALRAVSELAEMAGEKSEAERYLTEAKKIEENVLSKLRQDGKSLFYLNIDQKGIPHADVTGDLVFPALFNVGDRELRRKIVDRLFEEDLWTVYGARTVAGKDPTYDPKFGMNLMGGVWPNLTAWFAMAAAEFYPGRIAEAMEKIYTISEVGNPAEFGNVVPGEFPERLHGDDFTSMGMGMSPWMPPTYLWLAIEGLLGFDARRKTARINPNLPSDWRFLCAFGIPVRGKRISIVVYQGAVYTDSDIECSLPVYRGEFTHLKHSDELRVFKFTDSHGTRMFAFSPVKFEGNASIPLNEHSEEIDFKLGANELKEIDVEEAD